jgi:phosphoribosylformylglycinamidine cyclo-ligase
MGNVPPGDMARTFNTGIGCIMVVAEEDSERTVSLLKENGFDSYVIGRIARGNKEVKYE